MLCYYLCFAADPVGYLAREDADDRLKRLAASTTPAQRLALADEYVPF